MFDYRDYASIYANPRSRARGSFTWSKGDWSTTVFGSRTGSAWANNLSRRIEPLMFYNLTLSKRFGENVSADFIVNNVTDKHFREDNTNTSYPFFNYFQGADPVGRSYYVRLNYKF